MLFIPSLNQVANYTTMFFLLSYIVVNLACFLLSVTGAPNFRPSWRLYGWGTAVIGSIICAGAMFYMNPVGAAVSVALFMALFIYVMFRGPAVNWGDISQALIYHQVRKFLLRLDPRRSHVKYWRYVASVCALGLPTADPRDPPTQTASAPARQESGLGAQPH